MYSVSLSSRAGRWALFLLSRCHADPPPPQAAKELPGDILTLSVHDSENNERSMKISKIARTLWQEMLKMFSYIQCLLGQYAPVLRTGIKFLLLLRTGKNICPGTPYWQSVHLSVNHISTCKPVKYQISESDWGPVYIIMTRHKICNMCVPEFGKCFP